jgi:flagellar biogenesis protein FliO
VNNHDHVADIVQVCAVNLAAITVSLTDFETLIRITSLILACAYTVVKLWQALKNKPHDH